MNFQITSVHLLGAAVDNERISTNRDDGNGIVIQDEVGIFHNLYNPEDDVLEFVYPLRELDLALGKEGSEIGIPLPNNYHQENVMRELPDEDDHLTYRGVMRNGVLISDGAMNIIVKDWINQRLSNGFCTGDVGDGRTDFIRYNSDSRHWWHEYYIHFKFQ
jgi:hypothetical protein